MNSSQLGTLILLTSLPLSVEAAPFLPNTQDHFFELGLEALHQEAPGLRFSAAYLMSMGLPSLLSKVGLDLGVQFFPGMEAPAPEYGFFLESTLYANPSYAAYLKTGLYTITFDADDASETSMSSVGIELGAQWTQEAVFWEVALGARYRHDDPERIEVGSEIIEKEWLFYPKLGLGLLF